MSDTTSPVNPSRDEMQAASDEIDGISGDTINLIKRCLAAEKNHPWLVREWRSLILALTKTRQNEIDAMQDMLFLKILEADADAPHTTFCEECGHVISYPYAQPPFEPVTFIREGLCNSCRPWKHEIEAQSTKESQP